MVPKITKLQVNLARLKEMFHLLAFSKFLAIYIEFIKQSSSFAEEKQFLSRSTHLEATAVFSQQQGVLAGAFRFLRYNWFT